MTSETRNRSPLADWAVVDLTVGIAGGYATKILRDGGAAVVKVEPPGGDPLRAWTSHGEPPPRGEDGALFSFLASGKQSVVIEPRESAEAITPYIETADAVILSQSSPFYEHLPPTMIRALAPHAAVVAISPFGLGNSWSDRPATEFTVQAWSGAVAYRGRPSEPPVHIGGRIGDWICGLLAAVGLITEVPCARSRGDGRLVEVAMVEALHWFGANMFAVAFHSMGGRPMRTARLANIPGVEQTTDGLVGFHCGAPQQFFDFAAMVGRPEWAEDLSLLMAEVRSVRGAEIHDHIREFTRRHTTQELVELAALFRIPVAPVGNGATVTTFEQFADRDYFTTHPDTGRLQPSPPYKAHVGFQLLEPAPAPALGENSSEPAPPACRPWRRDNSTPSVRDSDAADIGLPFQGLRVLELTSFWAGPTVGHYLATLGADVIHVESPKRPDPQRNVTVRPGEENWWEWAPLFQQTNTNKRGLSIDLSTPEGIEVCRNLVRGCDLVIENYSPRVLEQWGLDYGSLQRLNSDIILVRMPAFGLDGPWRDRVGFAQTMEQTAGLTWMTGHPEGPPYNPNGLCDPVAGFHALISALLALEHRKKTGEGSFVEARMVSSALNVTAEQLLEYGAYGHLMARDGNHGPAACPQNLYAASDAAGIADDPRWVAIAIETDEQWRQLVKVVDHAPWEDATDLDTVIGRRRRQREIDGVLAAWCRLRPSDDIVTCLTAVGIPVAIALWSHEVTSLPPLLERNFFECVSHPITGEAIFARFPIRFADGGPHHRSSAPTVGEHSEHILRELLELDDSEYEDLVRRRIVGAYTQEP